MEEQNLSEHLKKALKDENSMEIRIWKMLTTQRKRTEARYYVNDTITRDQCGLTVSQTFVYNQSGIKKTHLRIHAITQFHETFTEAAFEKAMAELENADIIYQEDDIWHDSEDFDLPSFTQSQ